jgi:hypothetical protein
MPRKMCTLDHHHTASIEAAAGDPSGQISEEESKIGVKKMTLLSRQLDGISRNYIEFTVTLLDLEYAR